MTRRGRTASLRSRVAGVLFGTTVGVAVSLSAFVVWQSLSPSAGEQIDNAIFEELVIGARDIVLDTRLDARIESVADRDIYLPDSGVVTSWIATVGSEVHDGDILALVNSMAVLSVHSSTEFWRQIKEGDRGTDISEYQQFLTRRGYFNGAIDGIFGRSTSEAERILIDALGLRESGSLLLTRLPRDERWTFSERSVLAGETLSKGGTLGRLRSDRQVAVLELAPRLVDIVSTSEALSWEETAPASILIVELAELPTVDDDGDAVQRLHLTIPDANPSFDGLPVGAKIEVTVVLESHISVPSIPLAAVVTNANGDPAVRIPTDGAEGRSFELLTVALGADANGWAELIEGPNVGDTILVRIG